MVSLARDETNAFSTEVAVAYFTRHQVRARYAARRFLDKGEANRSPYV